ncbi:MAG TPA: pyrroline-5-carboxylate reductase [Holophaga sp.]|nr:pyrroline-5-carboxylate reductase [Holophaga sp.]
MPHLLAILGFGTMGKSIASGLIDSGICPAGQIIIADKGKTAKAEAAAMGVAWAATLQEAARSAGTVLLAVKPRDLETLLGNLRAGGALEHRPLVISIAAGVGLEYLEARVPDGTPVVRAMPNTPCAIRQGTIVLACGAHADEAHLERARRCFEPLGAVLDLEEHHMDAVTALSASGPAYIFLILEALAEGGVQCGLPRQVAVELAARMTVGAADMVLRTRRHPAALKDDVTTPAGCTIAGLLTLEDGRIRSVLARSIERAAQVASGLGQ